MHIDIDTDTDTELYWSAKMPIESRGQACRAAIYKINPHEMQRLPLSQLSCNTVLKIVNRKLHGMMWLN